MAPRDVRTSVPTDPGPLSLNKMAGKSLRWQASRVAGHIHQRRELLAYVAAREAVPAPPRAEPPAGTWLDTTWEGHRYPPFYATHFVHRARARRLYDGTIEAEFFDDDEQAQQLRRYTTGATGAGGNCWRRIVVARTAAQLYERAVATWREAQ